MLGELVKVRITSPYGSVNKRSGFRYSLNFGMAGAKGGDKGYRRFAYVMGIEHPIKQFDGRVIAKIYNSNNSRVTLVVAPKSTRYNCTDIRKKLSFLRGDEYRTECLFERSCGAVVYHEEDNERKYLLIRNRRSSHFGFPKGHMEDDETETDTAIREVFEETGQSIEIIDGFREVSTYTVHGKIEKDVVIFVATTDNTDCVRQEAEIDEIMWLNFDEAMEKLKFPNDKRILSLAKTFIDNNG